jgi:hypothetical protein
MVPYPGRFAMIRFRTGVAMGHVFEDVCFEKPAPDARPRVLGLNWTSAP